ncbi:MAG: hypothetical protein M3O46_20485 [Myxococcota bacterium]|nr:hypothetical protein [Myxococcota bacterium]
MTRSLALWAIVLVGAPLGVAATLTLRRLRPQDPPAPLPEEPRAAPEPSDVEPMADWCAPGFEPVVGIGCLAVPSGQAANALIVYLHGRYARSAAADEVDRQRRLAARATGKGFAVLALRGNLGACSVPDLADWYCWPSNERNAEAAPRVVDGFARAVATAHDRTGARARFLLGFSNGGYFAGLIASRGLLNVDAVVVAHGGPVEPVRPLHGKPPVLLLSADDDVAQDDMIRFDDDLARVQWAHDSYARFGGHALTDEDIDVAIAFFSRAKEPLPLDPPLPLHRAVRHVREAGGETEQSNDWMDRRHRSDEPAIESEDDAGEVQEQSTGTSTLEPVGDPPQDE